MNDTLAATVPATADEDERVFAKVSRRLIPLLMFAYIIAYLDRVNVGFAKLQMLQDLQFSETIYGLGAGIFFIGYFVFGVPSNFILHRIGARIWIAALMIAWGLVSAAMIFVTTPAEFYVIRFVLGVAEAGFFPGVIFYLTQWYPAPRRAQVTAVFMTGIAICGALGSVLSGAIMEAFHEYHGLAGWQWLFLIEALPAVLIGLYILVRLSDGVAQATWLSAGEKSLLTARLAADVRTKQAGTFTDAFRDRRVWLACVIYFCALTGLYGISFWLPTIVADMGIKSPLKIGALAGIPYAVAAVVMVLVGRSADRKREHRWHVAVPAALGAFGLAASALFAGNTLAAMVALTIATAGVLTVPPLFWNLPTAYLQGAAAASGIAFINSFGCLAGFISPYFVGWVKDATGSTDAGMYLIAAFVFLGAILVIAGVPRPLRDSRPAPR